MPKTARIKFALAVATLILPTTIFWANAQSNDTVLGLEQISAEKMRAHMEFLASDALEGRETGTTGFDVAANYAATQFKLMGLKPILENGSYFQEVPLIETRLNLESAYLSIKSENEEITLTLKDDYTMGGGYSSDADNISADLVFVGYGITAEEYGMDNYANVDVSGKIAVYFSGAPADFESSHRAYHSSSRQKLKLAEAHGAVGIIQLLTPSEFDRRPWERRTSGLGGSGMRWVQSDGSIFQAYSGLKGGATLNREASEKLFELAGSSYTDVVSAVEAGRPNSYALGISATLKRESSRDTLSSKNILAVIEGSDPALKNEYVVYSAHIDHIGQKGDEIFNGAYDNAAGTSTLLEIARVMNLEANRPRRSVLFALVTGEEKGLQGSTYLTANSPIPPELIVANINIDMPVLSFPVADIVPIGAEHSSLMASVEAATALVGLSVTPDPLPAEVRFVRSDQFSFVQAGIPAVAFKAGSMSADPEIDGDAALQTFLQNHYHQASDDLTQPFSFEGAANFIKSGYALGAIVANNDARVKWNENDFFGDMFGAGRD